jgi:hypothetical protein
VAISGNHEVQILFVNSNLILAITNLTLENGTVAGTSTLNATGAAVFNAGTLQITGCTFNNNSAVGGISGYETSSGYGGPFTMPGHCNR